MDHAARKQPGADCGDDEHAREAAVRSAIEALTGINSSTGCSTKTFSRAAGSARTKPDRNAARLRESAGLSGVAWRAA